MHRAIYSCPMSPETMTSQAPPARSRNRAEIPEKFKWNVQDIYGSWEEWDAASQAARGRRRQVHGVGATIAQGPDNLLTAFRLSEELGQLAYRVWSYPSLRSRRGSARQHDQRAPPAGPDPVRAVEAGGVVVQPGAAAGPDRHGAAVDGHDRGAAALSVRDREPVSPAGARARRSRRAADVAGQPAGLVAERRLLGALDRRREVSQGHALERRGSDRLLRPVPRDPRDAPRAGGPRARSRRCTKPTSRR